MAKDDDGIRLTRAELTEIVAAAASAAAEGAMRAAKGPELGTEEERFAAFSEAMHPKQDATKPSPFAEKLVLCKSPLTNATFTARVVASRSFPQGRIVDLLEYKHPDGYDRTLSEGGLAPDGVPVKNKDGSFTTHHGVWAWQTFWREDLRAFVGRPLPAHLTIEMQAKIAAIQSAAE